MAQKRGINNRNLREENRGLILKLIATKTCTSRIELAKHTGLSKMSVSNIISEFREQQFIEEQAAEPVQGQGRNPVGLCISEKAPKLIGVTISRDACIVVLCDLKLKILKKAEVLIDQSNAGELLNVICQLIDQIKAEGSEPILGIGVGSLGPVDIERGMLLNPPNFYGISDLPVTDYLYQRYQLPVFLDSQYNCAALAEKFFGIGREYRDFIFVGLTNGIGSGIVANEQIFRNSSGLTSELGHVSVDYQGRKCSCGNQGCLETYAGIRTVEKQLQEMTGEKSGFYQFCKKAGEQEDEKIDVVFYEMIDKLAGALVSTVNLLNSQAVIIGHEGYYLPDRYLQYLEEKINRQKLSGRYQDVVVKKSSFKTEAHLRGCVGSVLNCVFEGKGIIKN